MDSRYENKAKVGVALWIVTVPMAIVAGVMCGQSGHPPGADLFRTAMEVLLAVFMLVQYIAFFCGGSHLAKAKGYSNGVVIFGILPPLQLIILPLLLFGLPDKCPHRKMYRRKRK